ncbi:MAG: hypothetical protein WCO00_00880 [Rhodospirillaceae bacterium]
MIRVCAFVLSLVIALAAGTFSGSAPALADTAKPVPAQPFINQALPFYGCGIGVAIGAASVAFPRSMTQWTFYQGVYPSMATVLWRSTLGCFYGVVGGAVVSATQSTFRLIGDAWHRVF